MKGTGSGRDAGLRASPGAATVRLGGPARFAQAFVQRHARAARRVTGPELPLVAPGASQLHVVHSRAGDRVTRWDVKVQAIVQRVLSAQVRVEHAATPAGAPAMPVAAHVRAALPAPAGAPPDGTGVAGAVPRLVARGTRIENAQPARAQVLQAGPARVDLSAPPAARTGDPAWPDLPAVRPRLATPEPERSPGAGAAKVDTRAGAPQPAATIAPAALQEQEIARITELVMGSIDRRILAERERLGRF